MKFFKENKWETWRNKLSPSTKDYLDKQPIWDDKDLYQAMACSFILGILVGLCL